MPLNIVLIEPEIPQNTGNIARTCAATGSILHLIKPLGFSLDDKYVKRAGLDYWNLVDIRLYDNFDELLEQNDRLKFFYATTKARKAHSEMKYPDNCFLVFGKETKGIPEDILNENKERCIRIPMINIKEARSLNLSNSVNIVLYEVLRQIGFPNMF